MVCLYQHLWQIHLRASHRAPCVRTVMQEEQEEGAGCVRCSPGAGEFSFERKKKEKKKSFKVLSVVFNFFFSFTEDIGWKLLQQEPGRLCVLGSIQPFASRSEAVKEWGWQSMMMLWALAVIFSVC